MSDKLVKCPSNSTHNRFYTTAHEVHDWVVDATGEFVKDLGCSEISEPPDINNTWICVVCGADAEVIV